jgi:hypothetical protein
MEDKKLIQLTTGSDSHSIALTTDDELTPQLLRRFPGCENFSDEQLTEIITTIRLLAELLYNLALPEETHTIDYQHSAQNYTIENIPELKQAA